MDEEISALRRLDLNLLLSFDTLMSTRSATQAAHLLHKTQPGISRDLAKLRHVLDDALLVAVKGRFVPTERALVLHAAVHPALHALGKALTVAETFDPAQAQGVVDIGIGAHFELLLAGPLLQRLAQRAPQVVPKLHPVHGEFDPADLDAERQDIVIGLFAQVPARFRTKPLCSDERLAVMGPQHPLAGCQHITLDDLENMRWFAYTQMQGRSTNFDRALKGSHRTMNFGAYISGFGHSPHVLMESDYATTMPAFAAALHRRHFPLVTSRLPLPLREITFRMAWPRRQDASPLHRWVRSEICQLVAGHIESGLLKPPPRE